MKPIQLAWATFALTLCPISVTAGSVDDDLTAIVIGHADLAARVYADADSTAARMMNAIGDFLRGPTEASLESARRAWVVSRDAYGVTEAFRFAGGPIDDIHPITGVEGPEVRLNSWPVDEAYLDYVEGRPDAGIVNQIDLPVTIDALVGANGFNDESQVTLGYHAIEFLLWGQDRSTVGPGDRSYRDFLAEDPIRERRRRCLELIAEQLVSDVHYVAEEWRPGPTHFRDYFIASDPRDALSRSLSGAATLAGFELASERIGVPLASGEQEDEHSCFSDTTHRDFTANVGGLVLVLNGDAVRGIPGLIDGLALFDVEGAARVRDRLVDVRRLAVSVPFPIDRALVAPEDDPARQHLQSLADALLALADELQRTGRAAEFTVALGGG